MNNLSVSILVGFIKKLYKNRSLIKTMTVRNLKATYVGSIFGFLWIVLNPLAQVVVYGIVFGIFFKSRPDPVYGTESYFLFLLCGLVPWQFFTQAVSASSNVLVSNTNLIKKAAGFPSEILPIITVLGNIAGHLIATGLLLIVLFAFTTSLTPYVLFIFVYLFFISIFAVGLGWIFSSINVYLRDIQHVVGLLLMGWFFLTPVFYSPGIIPEHLLFIMKLNPMYHAIEGYRYALLAGRALPYQDIVYLTIVSFLTFGMGGLVFRKLRPGFAEVL